MVYTQNSTNFRYKTKSQINLTDYKKHLNEGTYIVFDIETTGGNPQKNQMTEICALKIIDGVVKDRIYSLINPKMNIPPIVRKMTGITNKMVRNAPTIYEVFDKFIDFIGDHILVSHNTVGDKLFLVHFAKEVCRHKFTNYFLCTHLLSEKLITDPINYSLSGLGEHLGLIEGSPLHRAEADAELTLRLFLELKKRLINNGIEKIIDALRFQDHLETNVQLGLAINEKIFDTAPSTPGRFILKDFHEKELFVSSSFNLRKDLFKLKQFDTIPKKLLRTLLQSYYIETREDSNLYLSMLKEIDHYNNLGCKFSPNKWHGRQIFLITLEKFDDNLVVNLQPYTSNDIIKAYGPVRDHKKWSAKLKDLARALKTKMNRRGVLIPKEHHDLILNMFSQNFEQYLSKLRTDRFKISNLLNFSNFKKLNNSIAHYYLIQKIKLLDNLSFLSNWRGVISVKHREKGKRELYAILDGHPVKSAIFREEDCKLHSPSIKDWANKTLSPPHHHEWEALKINATLWMIVLGSRRRVIDCQYLQIKLEHKDKQG